ncbi:MAG: AI-2E family transporter [Clostridiales bacterium]|nr:AI-2E family transporter [Clostridiales bacterium]
MEAAKRKTKRELILKIILGIGFAMVLLLLYSLRQIVLPFFLAGLFAYLLFPLAKWLIKKRLPLIFAVLAIYILLIGLLYLGLFHLLPKLAEELEHLLKALPDLATGLEQRWQGLNQSLVQLGIPEMLDSALADFSASLEARLLGLLEDLPAGLFSALRYLLYFLLAPILSYYLLRDREQIKNKLISWLPPGPRPEILRLAGDVNHLLRQFIGGYLTVAFFVGLLAFIILSLLRVKYALILGLIIGIFDLLPYFGPIIGAVPAVFLAFLQNKFLALYVALALFLLQQVEGAIISPRIIGKRIGLHPLIIIFVVLAGGSWFGLIGILLAVPVSAALGLVIGFVYSNLVAFRE